MRLRKFVLFIGNENWLHLQKKSAGFFLVCEILCVRFYRGCIHARLLYAAVLVDSFVLTYTCHNMEFCEYFAYTEMLLQISIRVHNFDCRTNTYARYTIFVVLRLCICRRCRRVFSHSYFVLACILDTALLTTQAQACKHPQWSAY